MTATTVFIGIDRAEVVRRAQTRKNMAELLGLSFHEFQHRFGWANLYGEDSAPRRAGEVDDKGRGDRLKATLPATPGSTLTLASRERQCHV